MDPVGALVTANQEFARRLELVAAEDWTRPTPCEEWDVRGLVNHVVGANQRYTMLLHGEPLAGVEATRSVDHLGDDPRARFAETAEEVIACFREPGVLGRTVHHRTGDKTGRDLLAMKVLDVAVHAWDLARAIGADETLDEEVVELASTQGVPLVLGAGTDAFVRPDDELPTASTAQDRLLHKLGRHPQRMETR